MAYFYGYLKGGKGTITRTGTKKSGISATLTNALYDVHITLQVNEQGQTVCVLNVPEELSLTINNVQVRSIKKLLVGEQV